MQTNLNGVRVAILATDGFEQSELFEPKQALEDAGAEVSIVSLKSGEIKGWKDKNWGDSIAVDLTIDGVRADDFDALHLPGGVINPDKLRMDEKAVDFVRQFFAAGKPVAAICHAPWTLVEADVVRGRTLTSWTSIRTDLENAGAEWVDQEVVVDGTLVTSRKPQDLPAYNEKIIEIFSREAGKSKQATNT
jgi:protease I